MNITFDTYDGQDANFILPAPNTWSRGTHQESETVQTQQGSVELTAAAYGDDSFLTLGWDELSEAMLGALQQLAYSTEAHLLRDLTGEQHFVTFGSPEYSGVPGMPGYYKVSVEVDYVWDVGAGTSFPEKVKPPPLVRRGSFAPHWKETGGMLSLFYPVEITPANGATGVNPKADVMVRFSTEIDINTFDHVSLTVVDSAGKPAGGGWTVTGDTAVFKTPYGFLPGETYKIKLLKGKDGLRGVGGWWIARDYETTFMTDARGQVVQDSLSFSGFTATAETVIAGSAEAQRIFNQLRGQPATAPIPITTKELYGALIWLEFTFDDDLISGEKAVQVSFLDEFSYHEGPTKVLERQIKGNTIRVLTTSGQFGTLKATVRGGSVGPVGKRRGKLALDRSVEYNVTPVTQKALRRFLGGVRYAQGFMHRKTGVFLQPGYHLPAGIETDLSYGEGKPFRPAIIDLNGPTLYPFDSAQDGLAPAVTGVIPTMPAYTPATEDAVIRKFIDDYFANDARMTVPATAKHMSGIAQAVLDTVMSGTGWGIACSTEMWKSTANDGSAMPALTAVSTNGELVISSVSQLNAGKFSVTFNVPLLDAEIPADVLQLKGKSGAIPAVAAIRSGKLEVSVGSYEKDQYELIITTGGFLRGERGFVPASEGRYVATVTAADGTPQLPAPSSLNLLSVTPNGSYSLEPGSTITLTFDKPVVLPTSAQVQVVQLHRNGDVTDVPYAAALQGNNVVISGALDAENTTVAVTVKGGPEGVVTQDGSFMTQTMLRTVLRTRYSQESMPPPATRPEALEGERSSAVWSFQTGPTFLATPGPWPLQGSGGLENDGTGNNAYVLTDAAPLSGGTDAGFFETLDDGLTVAALLKFTGAGEMNLDMGNVVLRVGVTGATLRVNLQLHFFDGTEWHKLAREWDTGRPVSEFTGRWSGVQVSYQHRTNALNIALGPFQYSGYVMSDPDAPRDVQAAITGRDVQLSEVLILDSVTSTQTLEDYFGTF